MFILRAASHRLFALTNASRLNRVFRFSVFVFFWMTQMAPAQTGRILGFVVDATTGAPIRTRVYLQPGNLNTATDERGNYVFNGIPNGAYTVQIILAGYKPFERTVQLASNDVLVDVELAPTGARPLSASPDVRRTQPNNPAETPPRRIVARRSNPESSLPLPQNPNTPFLPQSLADFLRGACPDLLVQSPSGNQTAALRFTFRNGGSLLSDQQPLVFLDGARLSAEETKWLNVGGQGVYSLAGLNVNDLADVQCLSGPAATARYGASGGGGVILLRTKRGAAQQPEAGYRFSAGENTSAKAYSYRNAAFPSSTAEALRKGSLVNHEAWMRGGRSDVRYRVSGYWTSHNGYIINDGLDRRGAMLRTEAEPFTTMRVSATVGLARADMGTPQQDGGLFGVLVNTTAATRRYGLADSSLVWNFTTRHKQLQSFASVQATYQPAAALDFQATVGFESVDVQGEQNRPTNARAAIAQISRGVFRQNNTNLQYEFTGNYTHLFQPDLFSKTTVGIGLFRTLQDVLYVSKDEFPDLAPTNVGLGRVLSGADEAYTEQREAGFWIEQTLNFGRAASVNAGFRLDDASTIGQNAQTPVFPWLNTSMNVDRFMPKAFHHVQVGLGIGAAGHLPASNSETYWKTEAGGAGNGWVLVSIGNPDLVPERIRETEFRISGQYGERATAQLRFYSQRVSDAIVFEESVPSAGLGNVLKPINAGRAKGWGMAGVLDWVWLESKSAKLVLNLKTHFQRNEVTNLEGTDPIWDGNKLNVIQEGYARHAFYAATSTGAKFDQTGRYAGAIASKLGDEINGHTADASGQAYLGSPTPNWIHQATFNLTIAKRVQFRTTVEAQTGLSVYNGTKRFQIVQGTHYDYNVTKAQLGLANRADVTPLVLGSAEYQFAADRFAHMDPNYAGNFVEAADFIKVRSLEIRWLVPLRNRGEGRLNRMAWGLSGWNLLTGTRYSGLDPEVNNNGARSLSGGQDFFTLPHGRTVLISAELGF